MQQHNENDSEAQHQWTLASWSTSTFFGIGVWVCYCGAAKRVIYNPDDLEVVDPNGLQGKVGDAPEGRGKGRWSGS